jgi:Alginate export
LFLTISPFLTACLVAQENPFMRGGAAEVAPPLPPAAAAPAAHTASAAPASLFEKFFDARIPDVLKQGKLNLNVRLRYEQVDEDNQPPFTKNSYAPTVRTRFGYTTAPLYGFQSMLEGVNVSVLGPEHNYNAAGSNGQGNRPPVGDPPLTRLDQAWLAYRHTNWFSAKAGRQRIVLDNRRFIGDVAWRQNMQTYDAAAVSSEPIRDLDLYYGYLWEVHRVFGNVSGLPPANEDFDSHSHLINISYSGWKYGRFAAYSYLLDLHNAAGDANSCATYGGSFAGAAPVSETLSLDYRAEFAWQTDYADNPLRYGARYYNLEAGANIHPVAFGAGYEDLGSGANTGPGGGRASFLTPLATLHAFNGWADVFLTTPPDGLRDLYGYFQVTLPAHVPLRFVYHKYDADHGGSDYGQEFDLIATGKFGQHWNAVLEYAHYLGQDAAPPALTAPQVRIQKFWAAVEFNY